jgi:hypothetical protein
VTSPFTAADYLQLACAGHHSVLIEVSRAGTLAGRILVQRGELWHAEDVSGEGLDALRRLLFLEQGDVQVHALEAQHAGPRRLHGHWQAVMLDAARSHDEHVRASSMPPAAAEAASASRPALRVATSTRSRSAGRPTLLSIPGGSAGGKVVSLPTASTAAANLQSSQLISERFNELLERAVEALLRRRLRDAFELFSEASMLQPDDTRVRANLERLGQLGFSGGPT